MELGGKLVPNDPNESPANVPYAELIGSLIWISTCTRPDISYATNRLAAFTSNPSATHWQAAKRVLRYLKHTISKGIVYRKGQSTKITGYVDSDWAGDTHDRRSTTGFVFTLAGSAISWESRKQRSVALSTCEAEYMSLSDASKELTFLQSLYKSILGQAEKPTLYTDSQSALKLSMNQMVTNRSKHIDIRYHYVRDCVQNGQYDLKYLPSANNLSDILTKSLSKDDHNKFSSLMGIS
jgi:hypothetical protein